MIRAAGLMAALTLLPLAGCSGSGSAGATAGARAPAAPSPHAMQRLFERSIDSPPSDADTRDFLRIAREAARDEDLRIFELSEAQFVALSEAERTRRLEVYGRLSRDLRRLARAAIKSAQTQASAGDRAAAERTLDAVARVARANAGDAVVKIGALTAARVQQLVDEARAVIAGGAANPPAQR